jgi:hypothetical protein
MRILDRRRLGQAPPGEAQRPAWPLKTNHARTSSKPPSILSDALMTFAPAWANRSD